MKIEKNSKHSTMFMNNLKKFLFSFLFLNVIEKKLKEKKILIKDFFKKEKNERFLLANLIFFFWKNVHCLFA